MLPRSRVFCCVVCSLVVASSQGIGQEASTPAIELFNQRILPIFKSEYPSSCVQCHLSSVDLKNYILPSSEKTFVSLRDQGLVDLANPAGSKILDFIRRGDKDPDAGTRLIHEKNRQAEYEAFAAWIEACCRDPRLRDLPPLTPEERARPKVADEVIRHARKNRVVDSFTRNVWSQRMRCFPCHTPHEINPEDPRHQAAIKTHKQFEENYGPELVERLNIFRKTPEETLQYLIDRSRNVPEGQLPLLNLENPRQSLLVLKPLSKIPGKDENGKLIVPAPGDPTAHMGGLKMHSDDQSYKSFVAWIQDYSNVVNGRYTSVSDLPSDNWHPTNLVIRLTQVPTEWSELGPVQLFVHAKAESSSDWDAEPVAFTQGTVTPMKVVNGALFLLGSGANPQSTSSSDTGAGLPQGDYLIKVYVDRSGQLAADPTAMLGKEDFAGAAVLKNARWREGFKAAETITAPALKH